ncbi:PilZ domain-containing protein [Cytobacillus spongiae]|uniref:PilZ domain-containing protein n=1 Tax=Cytobacillus spongiae TaxID=2901381 RepID=UPI001F41064A|nr:PilZ domain-containing protein [Cytobacillus spongiae]UII57197.1 PilZ domain-containing protein [Cytobacillus spongiae]
MIYRRDEAFRFEFNRPIHGTFKLLKINDKSGQSKLGSADIIDLSPNGLRFESGLDLPLEQNSLLIEVNFILNERLIRILGTPKWKKTHGTRYIYGFTGINDQETKKEIIEELKIYSKKALQQENQNEE